MHHNNNVIISLGKEPNISLKIFFPPSIIAVIEAGLAALDYAYWLLITY